MRALALAVALLLSTVCTAAPPRGLELLFVGDVSFAGRPSPRGRLAEVNPLRAFAERFAAADVTVANAEGLLTAAPPAAYGEARLNIGASPDWAGAFRHAHLSLVGVSNNHSWDGGAAGILESREHLAATGVAVMGVGATTDAAEAPWLLERDGRCRVAVVPATLKSNRAPRPGAAVAYYAGERGLDRLVARIRGLTSRGCFVVVSVHWGREAVADPPRDVVAAAHRLVDAGAKLVVGHHPHVLQGIERRADAAIAYSLGNFVFANRDPIKRRTGVLAIRLTEDSPPRLAEVALLPAVISAVDFVPRPATQIERGEIHERMAAGSKRFGTVVREVGDRLIFDFAR